MKLDSLDSYVAVAELSYQNCLKLGEFLQDFREKGHYGISTGVVRSLFNDSWKWHSTGSGHNKFTHKVTGITINYQNHVRDLDPGAAVTIAELVQRHINVFFEQYVGYPVNLKGQRNPDFRGLGQRLMQIDAERLRQKG